MFQRNNISRYRLPYILMLLGGVILTSRVLLRGMAQSISLWLGMLLLVTGLILLIVHDRKATYRLLLIVIPTTFLVIGFFGSIASSFLSDIARQAALIAGIIMIVTNIVFPGLSWAANKLRKEKN